VHKGQDLPSSVKWPNFARIVAIPLPAVLQRISKMLQGDLWQPSPFTVIFMTALVIYAVAVYYGVMNFNAILYIFVVKYLPLLPS
jgi:hypothetical protein